MKLTDLPEEMIILIAAALQPHDPVKRRIYEAREGGRITELLAGQRIPLVRLASTCKKLRDILISEVYRFVSIDHGYDDIRKFFDFVRLVIQEPWVRGLVKGLYLNLYSMAEYMRQPWPYLWQLRELHRLTSVSIRKSVMERMDECSNSFELNHLVDQFEKFEDAYDECLAYTIATLLSLFPCVIEVTLSTDEGILRHIPYYVRRLRMAHPHFSTDDSDENKRSDHVSEENPESSRTNGEEYEWEHLDDFYRVVDVFPQLKSFAIRHHSRTDRIHSIVHDHIGNDEIARLVRTASCANELYMQGFAIDCKPDIDLKWSCDHVTTLILREVWFKEKLVLDFLKSFPNLTKVVFIEVQERGHRPSLAKLAPRQLLEALKQNAASIESLCLTCNNNSGLPCSPAEAFDTFNEFVKLKELWIETWAFETALDKEPPPGMDKNTVISSLPPSLERLHLRGSVANIEGSLSWLAEKCKPDMLPQLKEIAFEAPDVNTKSIQQVFTVGGVEKVSSNVDREPIMW
ncbi:hypothetical protein C8035_v004500 [Colletotrichum spinosum]|uniref:F-box domain-containing protein n=1 Tax=Colletotrichum spinosum TaxID=1347390 RepID=A0A4R8PR85_9PEZI|nr:hypothetical protein C8035_v004500 [Colletotrichum spinosum]